MRWEGVFGVAIYVRKIDNFYCKSNIFVECNNCNIYWGGEEEIQLEW